MVLLVLIAAAFSAGLINALAGGGSFLTFPSLVFAGVPAVAANASSTVALVPASLTSGIRYLGDIRQANQAQLKSWFITSFLGGMLGSYLLLVTSDRTFRQVAPWLLLFATLLFAFGDSIGYGLRGRFQKHNSAMLLILFPVSVYGGYFGGGMGIMILAAFRLFGMTDIHAMNGTKALLGATLNAIASVVFISAHLIFWRPTLVMIAAGVAGGWVGPFVAKRTKPSVIKGIVIVVGVLMTTWFFYKAPR